jgi:NADPH:quinone reductase-like Zn-dependent oxidoreductase
MEGALVKSMQIVRFGGPEVFRIVESPSACMQPEDVRVRVTAAGINFADVMMRMGLYPEAPRRPFIPGYEVAGVVEEAGGRVGTFSRGDRVLAACRFGGYATEVVLPASMVRRIPAGLSDIEAAAIPVNFMTAWIALCEMARIREGDRVLVPGAAGGVGTAAVQIAVRAGAEVVGLVGSEAKKAAVLSLGAGHALMYGEWTALNAAERGEFDVVVDSRGGVDAKRSIGSLGPGGRLVSYGVSSMIGGPRRSIPKALGALLHTPILTPLGLAMVNKGVYGLNMLTLFDGGKGLELLMRAMDRVLGEFENGRLKVLVGRTFPLLEAGAAHAYLQSRANIGKVVLRT